MFRPLLLTLSAALLFSSSLAATAQATRSRRPRSWFQQRAQQAKRQPINATGWAKNSPIVRQTDSRARFKAGDRYATRYQLGRPGKDGKLEWSNWTPTYGQRMQLGRQFRKHPKADGLNLWTRRPVTFK